MPPSHRSSVVNAAVYSDLHWSNSDGLHIVARRWSVSEPRAAVLVVHGIGDHSGRFEYVAQQLNLAGFNVLAPDLRGHGRSGGQRGFVPRFESYLDEIGQALQVLRKAHPDLPIFIYGQSMGGLIVLAFTLRRKPSLSGIIVSSPALKIAMDASAWKVMLGRILRKTLPRFSLDSGLDSNELSDSPFVASRIKSDRLRHRRVTPEAFFGMLETGQWCLDHASDLACPALLLHGQKDTITSVDGSREFAAKSDNCDLRLWPNGKHELHNMTNRREVLECITNFQNRCIRGAPLNTD